MSEIQFPEHFLLLHVEFVHICQPITSSLHSVVLPGQRMKEIGERTYGSPCQRRSARAAITWKLTFISLFFFEMRDFSNGQKSNPAIPSNAHKLGANSSGHDLAIYPLRVR